MSLTNKRWQPPDGLSEEGLRIVASLQEYLLSLELPGAIIPYGGIYSPTVTGVTNVSGSPEVGNWRYMRLDNAVLACGQVAFDATGAGTTEVGISLPLDSTFVDTKDCSGVGFMGGGSGGAFYVSADVANARALISFEAPGASGGNTAAQVIFVYQLL